MKTLISIDNGGTLTDAIAVRGGAFYRSKALTTPHDLSECFMSSIAALSVEIFGEEEPARLLAETGIIRYSTTQGTNALVQARDKGPRIGLVLSPGAGPKGFCRTEAEVELFANLVGTRSATAPEEIEADKPIIEMVNQLANAGANRIVICLSGDDASEQEINLRRRLLRIFPRHFLGALPVLLSHELADSGDDTTRGWSAIMNAFLHPTMEHFLYNAEKQLREAHVRHPLLIFRNDGNSTRVARTIALKTYSSGPRGGMEGAKVYAAHYGTPNVLTMDIGGTTTDIGLVRGGEIGEFPRGHVEGVEISFPLSDIVSPGVGGSSVLSFEDGAIKVGPESVGAAPGPACFGYGGTDPTITDVYLAKGYFDPVTFFGGRLRIDREKAVDVIREKVADPAGLDVDSALLALDRAYHAKIADELKARVDDGMDNVTLMAFGGAGAMSACKAAEAAGISQVIVPHASSVFCAYGLGFSDVSYDARADIESTQDAPFEQLEDQLRRELFAEGYDAGECDFSRAFVLDGPDGETVLPADADILVDGPVRACVRAVRRLEKFPLQPLDAGVIETPKAVTTRTCLLVDGQRGEIPVFDATLLNPGTEAMGPALIEDAYSTLLVAEGWKFELNGNRDVVLTKAKGEAQ